MNENLEIEYKVLLTKEQFEKLVSQYDDVKFIRLMIQRIFRLERTMVLCVSVKKKVSLFLL